MLLHRARAPRCLASCPAHLQQPLLHHSTMQVDIVPREELKQETQPAAPSAPATHSMGEHTTRCYNYPLSMQFHSQCWSAYALPEPSRCGRCGCSM